jgi:uncharacterized protein (DUF2062 family)
MPEPAPPRPSMPWPRRMRYYWRLFTRLLLQRNDSPRQIAGGVAIGAFVACNPTVISQMAVAAIIATLFRCSRIPAIAMAYLSNPFTAVPIYGGGYLIGAKIVEFFGFRTPSYEKVKHLLLKIEMHDGLWSAIREKSVEVLRLGWAGLLPMEIGATIMGIVLAVPLYWLALRVVTGHRMLKAQKAAHRAQQRIERIRREQEAERLRHTPPPPPPPAANPAPPGGPVHD